MNDDWKGDLLDSIGSESVLTKEDINHYYNSLKEIEDIADEIDKKEMVEVFNGMKDDMKLLGCFSREKLRLTIDSIISVVKEEITEADLCKIILEKVMEDVKQEVTFDFLPNNEPFIHNNKMYTRFASKAYSEIDEEIHSIEDDAKCIIPIVRFVEINEGRGI